ncbi:PLDc N-terminal domain-containing protein [Clostridium omnivorum]|uniref:PLDc N-terminal domain-containing protein n=1 Tax=Clostridium omnivorum TaxID=1604902 RepID=UPI00222F0FA5|nr:PLDc N-terminal domain-containing protein [Clostridium sp. E14]
MLDKFAQYLPVLLPLIILQLILMVTALVHILRHSTVRRGSKPIWIIIVVCINIIGPILYFLFGKGEE